MANWKKVIVSGSNAELNHITASGNVSASGFLFGNLPSGTHDEVVIYDPDTGRLEFKVLNLVTTEAAPHLFLADIHSDLESDDNYPMGHGGPQSVGFKLSHDTGSSTISGVAPYELLSASLDGGATYSHNISLADSRTWVGLNDQWLSAEDTNEKYFEPGDTNITGSILDERQPLFRGENSSSITINLQSINNTNTAVPAYAPVTYESYGNRAFFDGGIGELRIYVNNNEVNSQVRTIDLTNYDAITDTVNGITANLFATASNMSSQTADTPDTTKHYRSGSFTIEAASTLQRDGYNYCFILHTGSKDDVQFARITNFMEWFYDIDGANQDLAIENQGTTADPVFDTNEIVWVSGIKYFNENAADNATVKFNARCRNQYRNIYPNANGLQFDGVTTNTITSFEHTQSGDYQVETKDEDTSVNTNNNYINLAPLQNVANANTTKTVFSASFGLDFGNLDQNFYQPDTFTQHFTSDDLDDADNDIAFTFKFDHFSGHKTTNAQSCTEVRYDSYLVNTLSPSANEKEFEDFKRETYRIVSRSYATGDASNMPSGGTHSWLSGSNIINGGSGHNKGLLQYYSELLYPTGAGVDTNRGNFATTLGPASQNDYGTAAGEREYFRYFKVTQDQEGTLVLNLELLGSGRLVSDDHTTHFGAGNNDAIKLYVWRSNGGGNSYFNGDFVNVFDSNIYQGSTFNQPQAQWIPLSTTTVSYSATNNLGSPAQSFRTGIAKIADAANANSFSENETIAIRMVVPENWTGYVKALGLQHGDTTTTLLNNSPYTGTSL